MTGLVVATEMEALPILRKLGGVKIATAPFVCFELISVPESQPHVLAICGMGKKAAGDATEHLISVRGAKAIVNVGICGSLKGDLDVGELAWVRGAVNGDAILAGQPAPEIPSRRDSTTGGMNIATVDQPVFDDARREALAAHADLVDMEAFGVAQTCQRLNVPFTLLKGVSDQADGGGRESLQANIREVSEMLAETLAEMFLPMTKACSISSKPNVVVVGAEAGEPATAKAPAVAPAAADPSTATKILRFTKIEHTLFSLPLLFAGAWLGAGRRFPAWQVLAWIVLAGVGARTLGMAMNRIFDRRLDALNPRTAGRELPAGRMSLAGAIGVAAAGLAVYLLACWGLGPICLMLSPVPAVPLIGYSLLKRFTVLCHFGIGLCLAIAPLAAFIAASGGVNFDLPVLLLAGFTFCWMSGFDIVYAMQDIGPDRLAGVHSIPAAIGARGAELVALATHAVALAAMTGMWQVLGGGVLPGIAAGVAVAAFAVGHLPQVSLARRFFPTSAIASIAAAMIVLLG